MQKNRLVITSVFLFMLLSLNSCGQDKSIEVLASDPWGTVTVEPGSSIMLGVAVTTEEAGLGPEGVDQERGIQLAVADRNRIKGYLVSVIVEEAACASYGGETIGGMFSAVADSVIAVLGPTCSNACSSAGTILEDSRMIEISSSCGASELTDPSTSTGLFLRTMYDDSLEGMLSAEFAFTQLGARRAAIIHYDNIDTQSLVEAFKTNFQYLGGTIVSETVVNPGDPTFSAILTGLALAQPDILYAPLWPKDAVRMTVEIDESHKWLELLGGRHYHGNWYLQETGDAADGIYATGPYIKTKDYQELEADYIAQFGEAPDSLQYVFAYDATNLLLDAIEQASAVDRSGNLIIGRQALQRAIFETSAYNGLTGPLTCTAWGNCSAENLAVKVVQDGKWVPVYAP